VLDDLRHASERVAKKSIEESIARQALVARRKRRRRRLTEQEMNQPPAPTC
jgi:hypothetical protein